MGFYEKRAQRAETTLAFTLSLTLSLPLSPTRAPPESDARASRAYRTSATSAATHILWRATILGPEETPRAVAQDGRIPREVVLALRE